MGKRQKGLEKAPVFLVARSEKGDLVSGPGPVFLHFFQEDDLQS